MTAYWKAIGALVAGLVVLIVAAIFVPKDSVLIGIAVATVGSSLGALAAPKNKD